MELREIIKKVEAKGENLNSLIFYFILIIFLRNTLESILEKDHILFLSDNLYTSLIMNIHFLFFYATVLISLLFITKILINRKTRKILSVLVFGFTIVLIAPIFDFIISMGKGFDLSYPFKIHLSIKDYLIKAFNPFAEFPGASPGMRIEIILMLILSFIYIKTLSSKIYKWVLLPLFYLMIIVFIGLIPLLISKASPDFWKGGITPFDTQKLGLIFGFIFVFVAFIYFLIFKEHKKGILRKFLNYDLLFFNLFLPFMGFWVGYKIFAQDFEIFFDIKFNRCIPLFILLPPLFYSLTRFLYRTKKEYISFTIIFSLLYSSLISFIHLFLIVFLYALFFGIREFFNTKKLECIERSCEATVLFIFGYSVFTKERFFYLMDGRLFAFIFIFFFFYGLLRYFSIKEKDMYGLVSFCISLLFLPLTGFQNLFHYLLLVSAISITLILYFLDASLLKTVNLISYFFITFFILIYLSSPSPEIKGTDTFKLNSLLHLSKFKEAEEIYKKGDIITADIEPLFYFYTGKRNKYKELFKRLKNKKEIVKWCEIVKGDKKYLDKIEEFKFSYPYAYFFLKSYFYNGENKVKNLILSLKYGFESPVLFSEIAQFYIEKKEFEKSMKFIDYGLKRGYSPLLELMKYVVFAQIGELSRAEEGFRSLLKRGYKNEVIYNNLGVIYMNRGEYGKAMEFFEKAIKMNPLYKPAFKNIEILRSRNIFPSSFKRE